MSQLTPPVGKDDHVQGPIDAPVVLVEYGDFQCSYCGQAYPELKAVRQAMGDGLCFVFREFPLAQLHAHAERAAEFAEAAASIGRFWEMHDLLFENQRALGDHHLVLYAERLGMDRALIEAALRGEFAARVQLDFASGVHSGVNGTPSLFVNGEKYEGPRDPGTLLRVLTSIGRG